ncbi:MAG TPA: DUF4136 domain-containing protein [Alphaproteobacteria bacterium]|nr:DUF4136 domain-containing protein [Alphaproteobacteria bacterium]
MLRLFALVGLSLLLAACQEPVTQRKITSTVSSFHRFSPDLVTGKTLAIEAFPPERQQSLEFAAYRARLAQGFATHGFAVVDDAKQADYLAVVGYGIDNGQQKTEVYSVPEYGQIGGGTTYHSGTVGGYRSGYGSYSGTSYTPPTFGVTGYSTNSVTSTTYTRTLNIDILDRPALDRGQVVKLYETKLVSRGSCSVLAGVFEYMANALFQDWPGESGKPQTVEMPSNLRC